GGARVVVVPHVPLPTGTALIGRELAQALTVPVPGHDPPGDLFGLRTGGEASLGAAPDGPVGALAPGTRRAYDHWHPAGCQLGDLLAHCGWDYHGRPYRRQLYHCVCAQKWNDRSLYVDQRRSGVLVTGVPLRPVLVVQGLALCGGEVVVAGELLVEVAVAAPYAPELEVVDHRAVDVGQVHPGDVADGIVVGDDGLHGLYPFHAGLGCTWVEGN